MYAESSEEAAYLVLETLFISPEQAAVYQFSFDGLNLQTYRKASVSGYVRRNQVFDLLVSPEFLYETPVTSAGCTVRPDFHKKGGVIGAWSEGAFASYIKRLTENSALLQVQITGSFGRLLFSDGKEGAYSFLPICCSLPAAAEPEHLHAIYEKISRWLESLLIRADGGLFTLRC